MPITQTIGGSVSEVISAEKTVRILHGTTKRDLFTITGKMQLIGLYGVVQNVVDNTSIDCAFLALTDGYSALKITGNDIEFTGFLAGQIVDYTRPDAQMNWDISRSDGNTSSQKVVDVALGGNAPGVILDVPTSAVLSLNYTPDLTSDMEMNWKIFARKLSPDASIVSV